MVTVSTTLEQFCAVACTSALAFITTPSNVELPVTAKPAPPLPVIVPPRIVPPLSCQEPIRATVALVLSNVPVRTNVLLV